MYKRIAVATALHTIGLFLISSKLMEFLRQILMIFYQEKYPQIYSSIYNRVFPSIFAVIIGIVFLVISKRIIVGLNNVPANQDTNLLNIQYCKSFSYITAGLLILTQSMYSIVEYLSRNFFVLLALLNFNISKGTFNSEVPSSAAFIITFGYLLIKLAEIVIGIYFVFISGKRVLDT